MLKKYSGHFLFGAVLFGPTMFGILIIMNLNGGGFSFLSHMVCSLAVDSISTRIVFGVAAWGMALLHIPFFLYWPEFIASKGSKKVGKNVFLIFGILFVVGFFLFPFIPLDPDNLRSFRVHQVVAVFFFSASIAIPLICAINILTIQGAKRIFSVFSLLWSIISMLFLIPFVILALHAPPYPGYVNLLNWIYLLVYGPWAILHALLFIGKISIVKKIV